MSPADDATHDHPPLDPTEVFERAGGMDAFEQLVDAFYARVEHDELLRPMYPEDLEPGKRHLAQFLAQYWGAGDVYSSHRGHPRLRMRHAPFDVTPEAALRWADHMSAAIRDQQFHSDVEALLLAYVQRATPTLINRLPDDVVRLPSD
ncbi:globin [Egicoccus sp. AB-alg2]|uniref:globin domain-containing protein n=1 Tax=Egicoccus sp. AB-alg2 TaxID=3242693 RepID=UPI00359CCB65